MSPSIGGIGGGLPGLGHLDNQRGPAPAEERQAKATAERLAAETDSPRSVELAGDTPQAAAVDPELWGVLSAEERVFYLRNAMTGPLTYAPDTGSGASSAPGSRLGGRIDVRA